MKKLKLSTIVYTFSFLVVFPISMPVYLILAMMLGGPSVSASTSDIIYICFLLAISILGATILNAIFRFGSLNKNNKYTWGIYIAHLILIPISVHYIYPYLFFR